MPKFSKELFDNICDQIAEGKSLRSICRQDDMPSKSNVMRWLNEKPELQDQYTRARNEQADTLFEECLDIADNGSRDVIEGEDGKKIVDHEVINRARLRIDTRKWMAGKLRPKKYGDKVVLGGDNDMDPIKTEEVGGAAKLAAYLGNIAERS